MTFNFSPLCLLPAPRRRAAGLRSLAAVPAVVALLLAGAACGRKDGVASGTLRVGYFANITHAQAIIGRAKGTFEAKTGLPVAYKVFNAGPTEMEALLAGEIDIAYVGPNPAINAYLRAGKGALRIVAGATSGGASLVVRRELGLRAPADLKGRTVASPELGNTQDITLRAWLKQQGFTPGTDVKVKPVKNPEILMLFRQGSLDAAWVPEPWATRLCREAGGEILIDETSLWPGGRFTTAVLVVREDWVRQRPDVVRKFVEAHVETTRWSLDHPAEAVDVIRAGLEAVMQKPLSREILSEAFSRMKLTWDPGVASMRESAARARDLGYLPPGYGPDDIGGLFELAPLGAVLQAMNLPPVQP
ncbi:MAG: aliphatic sulfonate ABC transporter substrate-binding protein [Acidobacteria bacterium]|nr:aliphatic sulfonate ABC transporter substrate-binding protein [Acidobacteriota bacterium]